METRLWGLKREGKGSLWVSTSLKSCHEGKCEASGKKSGITPRFFLVSVLFLVSFLFKERPRLSSCKGKGTKKYRGWNTREKGNGPPWHQARESLRLQEEQMKEELSAH